MDNSITKGKRPRSAESSNLLDQGSTIQPCGGESIDKKACVEFCQNDIITDPALRKPIEDYDAGIRDEVRRQYLAKGPCQPYGYNFPPRQFGKNVRRFRDVWFIKYQWLEYSTSKDAAFCFWCYLFRGSRGAKHGDDAFTKMGFTNWKKAIEKFNDHIGRVNSPHNNARIKCFEYKNQRQSVPHVSSFQIQDKEAAYRTHLIAVIDVIRFLLGQGLALDKNDELEISPQKGNFLALLNWCKLRNVDLGNNLHVLENNELTSSFIQKQIASAFVIETTQVIINEIGDKFYSLLIGEAWDSSMKEQMTVILRYVNKFGEVVERFLGVVHVGDVFDQSLKNALIDFLAKHGLSLSKLRGIAYDGTSNMRGRFNELKVLIINENPHAKYIHCFAEQFQSVIVSAAKDNNYVGNFFNFVSMIVDIVEASCETEDALQQKQHDQMVERLKECDIFTRKGMLQERFLTRPDEKCGGSYYRTIICLLSMWHSVVEVLLNITENGVEQKNRGIAVSLVDKIEDYEFVFIAHLMKIILGITNNLSLALQQKDQNIENAIHLTPIIKERLQELRETGWDELLEEINKFCMENDVIVPNMEENVSGRIRSKCDGRPITYFHHFHKNIYCQVIDFVIREMEDRFTESNMELLMCMACLDPRNSFSNFNHSRLLRFAELYPDEFSICDRMELKEQLKTYILEMKRNDAFSNLHDVGALAKKMVERGYHTIFALVYKLIELELVLPIVAATVERAFFPMNFIKTDLHNKMGDDFLTDYLVCYVEKEIFVSIETEAILQRFQNMQPLRSLSPLNYS